MFLDEPEGNSFADLNQYLGAASAMGNGIDIQLEDGTKISAYLNHSQSSLPDFVEVFMPKGDGREKAITKVPARDIVWFKLRRDGRTESYIDENGIPTAKLPIVMIRAKQITGGGKIKNPGVTSIQGDEIYFPGELTLGDEDNEK